MATTPSSWSGRARRTRRRAADGRARRGGPEPGHISSPDLQMAVGIVAHAGEVSFRVHPSRLTARISLGNAIRFTPRRVLRLLPPRGFHASLGMPNLREEPFVSLSQTLLLGFIAGVHHPARPARRSAAPPGAVAAGLAQRDRRRRPAVPGLGRPLGGLGADRRGPRRRPRGQRRARRRASATARCSPPASPSACSSLVCYERWMARARPAGPRAPYGPGAMAVGEVHARRAGSRAGRRPGGSRC